MKKYLIIALFIIFTLVCFSGNTYSALNVYPCDAEIYAYITQADDHSYVSILYLSNGTDFKLDNEEEYEKGIYSIVLDSKKSDILITRLLVPLSLVHSTFKK